MSLSLFAMEAVTQLSIPPETNNMDGTFFIVAIFFAFFASFA